ncbi:MAG TPA: hypothetical protein VH352_25375, partial [Pseudonocardiaceae bacterium]|nr:hypothetical protein [Pseudonocardiaceae bacterium]
HVVRDHLHSALMWDAMRGARRRLVITSDLLSSAVVTGDFVDEIRLALDRGVHVAIVYRRLHDEAGDKQAVTELERLRDESTGSPRWGRLIVRRVGDSDVKALICDDEVVVGSYGYLSFHAQPGAGRWQPRSEIGLRIVDEDVATDAAKRILGDDLLAGVALSTNDSPPALDPGAYRSAEQLLRMLSTARPDVLGEIAERGRAGGTEFAVVDALAESGADPRAVEQVCAAVFASATDADVEHDAWGVRLLQVHWRRGRWSTAHLLRAGLPAACRPRPTVTIVAATVGGDPGMMVDRLTEIALLGTPTPAEATALATIGAVEMLRTGDVRLAEPLPIWYDCVPPSVRDFIDAANEYVGEFGLLAADTGRVSGPDDPGWTPLGVALDEFRLYNPNHPLTGLVKDHLFGQEGVLGVLDRIVAKRDGGGLAGWVEQDADTNVARWLNKQTKAAGSSKSIDDNRRRSMLYKGGRVLAAARELASALVLESGARRSTSRAVSPTERTATARIAALAGALRATLAPDLDIEHVPAAVLLDELITHAGQVAHA